MVIAIMPIEQNRLQRYYKKMKNTNYSVKKHLVYLILLPLLAISVRAQAEVNHYVGAYATAAEWSLLPKGNPNYDNSVGFGGGLGALYELRIGPTYGPTRFLVNLGVGATGGLTSYLQSSSMTMPLANQRDLQGNTFDYVYEVADRHDQYQNIALNVPLMVGVQHKKFYMLVGAKLYYNLWTQNHSTALVNTYGDYEGLGEFRHMPEWQFFDDVKVDCHDATHFNIDIDASLEIGGRFGFYTSAVGYDVPKRKIEYRLAAFVDYGLIDLHTADTQSALSTPTTLDQTPNATTMVDNLVLKDIMSTSGFASSVNNLMIGLKFTVLFELPKPGQCLLCRDNYRRIQMRSSGGGTGMKYEE